MGTTPARQLTYAHQDLLAKSGIPADAAREWGVFSAARPEDLNGTDLDHVKRWVPFPTGIVYPLRRPDGTVTYQLRKDNPELDEQGKPLQKYVQARDTGAIINVPAKVAHLTGKAKRVAVIEGTKQTIAATLAAPDDMLVIGIQGCGNFSLDGIPLAVWDDLVSPDAEAFIVFDADWRTNRNVWEAAERLKGHLETALGVSKVRVADLRKAGLAGTNGLDDFLAGGKDKADRAARFERLLEKAVKSLGARPAKKAKAKEAKNDESDHVVDWEHGRIGAFYDAEVPDGQGGITKKHREDVIADFAALIVESRQIVDDLNPNPNGPYLGVEHDLAIAWGGEGTDERFECRVNGVPDGDLRDPRNYLSRTPGGAGTTRRWKSVTASQAEIESAIRSSSRESAERTTKFSRTGLVARSDGHAGYLFPSGTIVASGAIETDARAHLRGRYAFISYPDLTGVDEETVRAAVRASFTPLTLLADPSPWVLLVGAAGLSYSGTLMRCVPAIAGEAGSGKTWITHTFATSYGPRFAKEDLGSAADSAKKIPDFAIGLHQHPALLDDLLKTALSVEARSEQVQQLDVVARRVYGGGTAGRGRLRVNKSGVGPSVVEDPADGSCPCIVLIGETMPTAVEADSLAQRLLVVWVKKYRTIGCEESLYALGALRDSGQMNVATSSFIAYVCAQADAAGGLDEWVSAVDQHRNDIARELMHSVEEFTDPRQGEVLSGVLAGWELRLAHAVAIGALTEADAAEYLDLGERLMTRAAVTHGRSTFGRDVSPAMRMLDRIKGALQGRATIGTPSTGQRRIGALVTPRRGDAAGTPCVGLLAGETATVLGMPEKVGAATVSTTLAPLVVDRRSVNMGEFGSAYALLIPLSQFEDDDAEVDDLTAELRRAGVSF